MTDYFVTLADRAAFDPERATKSDLFRGAGLFVGLNCFEPGQAQRLHAHAGADKFYLVVSGKARITVGGTSRVVESGTIVWAPANVPHGIEEAIERTIVLTAIAPPPGRRDAEAPAHRTP